MAFDDGDIGPLWGFQLLYSTTFWIVIFSPLFLFTPTVILIVNNLIILLCLFVFLIILLLFLFPKTTTTNNGGYE